MKINTQYIKDTIGTYLQNEWSLMAPYSEDIYINEKGRPFWYLTKPDSKILLVAHVDTVIAPKLKYLAKRSIGATGLDDRLGVMMAIETHLHGKTPVDVLITHDEETGGSTADGFDEDALLKYNLIIELDRAGIDYVDYHLGHDDLHDDLSKLGIKKGRGSFSDIKALPALPCSAFNLGIGYEGAHAHDSFARYKDIILAWARLFKCVQLGTAKLYPPAPPYVPPVYAGAYRGSTGGTGFFNSSTWQDRFATASKTEETCSWCGQDLDTPEEKAEDLCVSCVGEWERLGYKNNTTVKPTPEVELTVDTNCSKCGRELLWPSEVEEGLCYMCVDAIMVDVENGGTTNVG